MSDVPVCTLCAQGIDYDDDTASFMSQVQPKASKAAARDAKRRARELRVKEKEQKAELQRRRLLSRGLCPSVCATHTLKVNTIVLAPAD